MFACTACLRTCIRAIATDVAAPLGSTSRVRSRQHARFQRPSFLTARVFSDYAQLPTNADLIDGNGEPRKRNNGQTGHRKRSMIRGEIQENELLDLNRLEDHFNQQQLNNLAEELAYLKDPFRLAEDVQFKLSRGKLGEAVYLTRMASKIQNCVVSWNHLIKFQLTQGRVKSSVKLYNEMKKRGQQPDAHTYTILLRGLAENTKYPIALEKALSIYHSLWAPNSKLKPSIIHSNAVLKVCARAGDLDSLWGIAGKLPRSGINSADGFTYTTILNTIRRHALEPISGEDSVEQMVSRRDAAVLQGRQMWDDIVSRWWGGEIRMDEELACSVGRLLLIGSKPRDWDDILSLVEQTMGIPRLIPRLGSEARRDSHTPKSLPPPASQRLKEPALILDGSNAPGGEFNPQPPSHLVSPAPVKHLLATPSRNTLSLVLEACLQTRILGPAKEYWTVFTEEPYSVKPDSDNITRYLRLLRLTRSSAIIADFLDEALPNDDETAIKHCRIAMSACRRDAKNPNVMNHAKKILDIMYNRLESPDATTMYNYLETARATGSRTDIKEAIRSIEPALGQVKSVVFVGPKGDQRKLHQIQEVWHLLRGMVGSADKLLESKSDMTVEERALLQSQRSQWHKWSFRYRPLMGEPVHQSSKSNLLRCRKE